MTESLQTKHKCWHASCLGLASEEANAPGRDDREFANQTEVLACLMPRVGQVPTKVIHTSRKKIQEKVRKSSSRVSEREPKDTKSEPKVTKS